MNLPTPRLDWAARIAACWLTGAEATINAGRLLNEAKAILEFGDFEAMIESDLPFTPRTAQMLMAIARDPRLTNPKRVSLLPPSWGTLYELTRLPDEALEKGFSDGTIGPDVERSAIVAQRKAIERQPEADAYAERVRSGCTVDDLHELASSGYKAGTILTDPPWKFITRSVKGGGRSPTYRTDPLVDIKALPVAQLAAPNAMCLIWCVDWLIPGALDVMAAWQFEFKTVAFTWAKRTATDKDWHMGQGFWTRANPEMCLLGTRGSPKRLHADVRQLIVAPVMEHSRKPDEVYDRVERLVGGPYLELYGRRERDGWKTWGNEIAREAFDIPVDGDGAFLDHDPSTGEIVSALADAAMTAPPAEPTPHCREPFTLPDLPEELRRVPVAFPRVSQSDSAGRGD